MPLQLYNGGLMLRRTKLVETSECCCNDICVEGIELSRCYNVSVSAIDCDNSWFNGLTVKVTGLGPNDAEHDPNPNNYKNFDGILPPQNPEEDTSRLNPWKTVQGGPPRYFGFTYFGVVILTTNDYFDENNEPKRRIISVEIIIFTTSITGSVSYAPIRIGAVCEETNGVYLWTTTCGDVTVEYPDWECLENCFFNDIPPEECDCPLLQYTYFDCTDVKSEEPITVPPLHGVVDVPGDNPNAPTWPGLNDYFIHRFSGCEDCCADFPPIPDAECADDGSCKTGYLIKFSVSPTECDEPENPEPEEPFEEI